MYPAAITVENLSKRFFVPHDRFDTIKQRFVHPFRRMRYEPFYAFQGACFEVQRGEWIGIVGKNGSGKSTLLKVLAGIYQPDTGTVHIRGTVVPLLELGVGFNPELTAKENVYLYGALLNLPRQMMKEKFNSIIGFAGVEKFLDMQLKNFSSGMKMRLAFSIVSHIDADIYLFDEIFAVGDAEFHKKCMLVFDEFKKQKKTVLFTSHDATMVSMHADRSFLLHESSLIHGSTREIIGLYEKEGGARS